MKKYVVRFLLKKVMAIAMILVGIHMMASHIQKELPFGIVSDNIGLWGVWAYFGLIISIILIANGIWLLGKEIIEKLEKIS